MRSGRIAVIAAIATAMVAPLRAADPAGITVLCSNGLKAVMDELVPQFERSSKGKASVTYGLAANLKREIEGGAAFDLAVLTPAAIDDLIKQGKIDAKSRTTIARSSLAVAIKSGAKKPDISTTDGFKRALLGAKAVAFAREGASGIGFQQAAKKLGIAEHVRNMPTESGEAVGQAVLKGDADFGILPVSEIVPVKGIEVLGTFPADVQSFVVMVGGINAGSPHAKAATSLIEFLMAPAALPVVKKFGMERAAP